MTKGHILSLSAYISDLRALTNLGSCRVRFSEVIKKMAFFKNALIERLFITYNYASIYYITID